MPIQTAADSISNSAGSPYGFKNRIINGAMAIDQRNAGASSSTTNTYTLDRWITYTSQSSKFTWGQNLNSVTPPEGFTNYLGVQSSSSYSVSSSDYFVFDQCIEGFNVSDLGWGQSTAKSVTLSFWVRSSLTGTFGGSIQNSASNRAYGFSYTINSANTWEQKTITIAGDITGTWLTNNGVGIRLRFGLGVGSSLGNSLGWQAASGNAPTGSVSVVGTNGATWYITGVQLEKGSQATAFDYRDYGTELNLCQRYYEKSYDYSIIPGSSGNLQNGSVGLGIYTNNPAAYNRFGMVYFQTRKRTGATITLYAPATGTVDRATSGDGSTDILYCTSNQANQIGFNIAASVGGSTTTNYYTGFFAWTASAEL
jgi:hypothetical protein